MYIYIISVTMEGTVHAERFYTQYANAHTYKKYCYYNQVVTFRYLSNLVVEVLCTAFFLFLQRRLASAAKKAIAKIPQRTLKAGDKVGRYEQLLSTIRLTLSHHRGTHHQQPQCQTNYHSVLKEPWFKVALDGHRGDRFVPTIPMANQL